MSTTTSSTGTMSATSCDHNSLIRRQFMKIESLENELAIIRCERDSLLGENERLCFQLQMMSEVIQSSSRDNRQQSSIQKSESSDGSSSGCHDNNHINTNINTQFSFSENKVKNSQNISRKSIITTNNTISNTNTCYELSQQLIDKRVSALERKYGGLLAREAAVRIQRAFRTYRLQKRFQSIAFCALKTSQKTSQNTSFSSSVPSRDSSQTTLTRGSASSSSTSGSENYSPVSGGSAVSVVSMTPTNTTTNDAFECQRKRQYRVGLNLFNKHPPERGIQYLISNGFIESAPTIEAQALNVARFLLTRKGVSKAMIGEYISTNQNTFNQLVLKCFAREIDLSHMSIDGALRKFQTYFRFPGEAQKIERLVDCFATRFVECQERHERQDVRHVVDSSHDPQPQSLSRDSVFVLSFAIIMLNTDLHSPTNHKSRMTAQQWVRNLEGVFSEGNLAHNYLIDIYERIKSQEFRTGADHVTQVLKVQSAIVGAKEVPNLCLTHRRLVCYCRLYEVLNMREKRTDGKHQREVFLFNDLLLVTKLTSRSKQGQTAEYLYRSSFPLDGMVVGVFSTANHMYGIRLSRRVDDKLIVMFNARNELDQKRFCDDLRESCAEMDEMNALRITKSNSLLQLSTHETRQTRDADNSGGQHSKVETNINVLNNNSLNRRKSSSGSLDSGLSLPSRDHSPNDKSGETIATKQLKV